MRADISVVVATRNRAGYLAGCLESLAKQKTTAKFEVVVVDNGSDDGTSELLQQWCDQQSNLRVLTEKRRFGKSRALNAGFEKAVGGLLLVTDDDALVDPDWIEAYRTFFEGREDQLLMAGGLIRPVHPDLKPWPRWLSQSAIPLLGELDHGSERPLKEFEHVWGPNLAFSAQVFNQLGPWDESAHRNGRESERPVRGHRIPGADEGGGRSGVVLSQDRRAPPCEGRSDAKNAPKAGVHFRSQR
jgi:glycosyltransferase involved in cell wall biosynthesis